MAKEKIGVVGTGNIGACYATLSAGNGFDTTVIAYNEAEKERCINTFEKNFADLASYGLVTEANIEAARKLLHIYCDYSALDGCEFVFEATLENINVKKEVYANIEAVVASDTIIASSTSSITAEQLAEHVKVKERLIVAHPFQPAHLLPLVELVGNSTTTPEILAKAKRILESMDRQVVVLHKDAAGFIVNRLAQALFRESLYLVEQGVATVEDIDKSIKYAVGMRYASIGLLEYFDDVGFDLEKSIALNVYPDLCGTTEIQDIVNKGIEAGTTGLLAGKGLYDWSDRDVEEYRQRKLKPYLDTFHWNLPE
ncbi:MAG: 3-hydroxyacyl-CoA dehydrogenase family protein [Eubacteriales bacterium]|nr:3-hydroxyacyl-CoA dehydrogenase family protein [Eubacteriales bacterium]